LKVDTISSEKNVLNFKKVSRGRFFALLVFSGLKPGAIHNPMKSI